MDEQRFHLTERYPRLLAAFGAWIGVGAALLLLGSEQTILGIVLSILTAGIIVVGFRGSRMSERTYRRLDLRLQWISLILPVGFVGLLILMLGRFIVPLLGYLIGYFLVLLMLAVFAGRELLRVEPVSQNHRT